MSYKIYLVRHLDTDMKYVGITTQTLKQRWAQHSSDRMSALYKVMRTEKNRMSIEVIEEVFDKYEALTKEQYYIQLYETEQPKGWNRYVTDTQYGPLQNLHHNYRKSKKWKRQIGVVAMSESSVLSCPACGCNETKKLQTEIFVNRRYHVTASDSGVNVDDNLYYQPVEGKQVVRFVFICETCHPFDGKFRDEEEQSAYPPHFEYILYEHKRQMFFETIFYVQDTEL